jgi:hypothetical protein
MIVCDLLSLEQRCHERGYTLAEVAACYTRISGDDNTIRVDETHDEYPRTPKHGYSPKNGPGSLLKKTLAGWPFFLSSSNDCSCDSRARHMDVKEYHYPGWCEENIDTVVGWLREEATKRGLPFLDAAGRLLVRRAIRNARRAAAT